MQTVFKFHPIYKERPWGGQSISKVGQKRQLPSVGKIGESWEISDRDGNESVIMEGPFKGKSIRWLLDEHGFHLMGRSWKKGQRFPLLVKLLDATERLSLQVHPSELAAHELGGESKNEMWYFLDAEPHAAILAGLKKDVRREDFEKALCPQNLESLIHRIPVHKGDAIFIPAGRIHAIDAGCLILEVQQNSDTTYRIYDWGRLGSDNRPRDLHVKQSLRCINFNDFEPKLIDQASSSGIRQLAFCEYFRVIYLFIKKKQCKALEGAAIIHVLCGEIEIVSVESKMRSKVVKGGTVLLSAVSHQICSVGRGAELIAVSNF